MNMLLCIKRNVVLEHVWNGKSLMKTALAAFFTKIIDEYVVVHQTKCRFRICMEWQIPNKNRVSGTKTR